MSEIVDLDAARREQCVDVPAVTQLPFVCDTPENRHKPRCFWSATPSGDIGADCRTGTLYALAALRYMRDAEFTPLLGWIISDMIAQNHGHDSPEIEYDGLVIGFCQVIANVAVSASHEPFLKRVDQHYSPPLSS